uniref:Uncharacterized protein n=1 Tax=Onchocerca volvulus TaxID=6282 RepID=A0A8R1TUY9_ONCVO
MKSGRLMQRTDISPHPFLLLKNNVQCYRLAYIGSVQFRGRIVVCGRTFTHDREGWKCVRNTSHMPNSIFLITNEFINHTPKLSKIGPRISAYADTMMVEQVRTEALTSKKQMTVWNSKYKYTGNEMSIQDQCSNDGQK